MKRLAVMVLVVLLLGGLLPAPAVVAAVGMGEPFPEVALPLPDTPAERHYLGLTANRTNFTLSQVQARVVLVELLNVLCPHCQQQTGPYNRLYQRLQADPQTRGRVKMLGVAVANSQEQIDDFISTYQVRYPIVADKHFLLHRALRAGQTPLSLYVLLDPSGKPGIVAGSQLGEDERMDALFAYLKELLTMNRADFAGIPPDDEVAPPPPPLAGVALEKRIKAILRAQGDRMTAFHQLQLPSRRPVWGARVRVAGGERQLYAALVGRSAICDVCHNVHFIYVFDQRGRIVAFEPLHLTKYGNAVWNDREVDWFRRRVVGRNLDGNWSFDPKVDAVTSATMTSAIIYDSLGLGEGLLKEIQQSEPSAKNRLRK